LDDRNVRRAFRAILRTAKLPTIRIHDLRHTCASLLLVQGVHPRVVMETLGHSQISLTLDTHSHVLRLSSRKPPARWILSSPRKVRL
jgi:integrase